MSVDEQIANGKKLLREGKAEDAMAVFVQAHADSMPVEMKAGDCLLFSTRLFHRSGGNTTQGHRRVITLHMASARCRPTGPQFSEFGFTSVRGETFETLSRLLQL